MRKKLIDKDALVAEIKKKISTEQGYSSGDAECGYRDCARDILSFLDTLEVKEGNDLEKDEDYINDLIGFFYQNNKLRNTKADIINWLKSLKE